MNKAVQITLVILLCLLLYSAAQLFRVEEQRRVMKEDLIELAKIKYGLFNVDEWKKLLSGIISKKIEEFSFRGSTRAEMRRKISELLYKIVGDFEIRYKEQNSRGVKGFLRKEVASFLGIFSSVKKDVPKFTEQILDFLNEPRNRKALKAYINDRLNEYAAKTFSTTDYRIHDAVVKRYEKAGRNETIVFLTEEVGKLERRSRFFGAALVVISAGCALMLLVRTRLGVQNFGVLTVVSVTLLMLGLLLPMIEIDARIASMRFNLLGEPVIFQDQVLYYKSKSIIEVVVMMLEGQRVDLLLVGLLVFLFSVLFPIGKLVSVMIYLWLPGSRGNRILRFMIFRTGKWSMADVMVVAIFMAYIGFSGIITEQLKQLENLTTNLEILTTNKSSLLAGFFAFTSFAILSLLVSHKLQYQLTSPAHEKNL